MTTKPMNDTFSTFMVVTCAIQFVVSLLRVQDDWERLSRGERLGRLNTAALFGYIALVFTFMPTK